MSGADLGIALAIPMLISIGMGCVIDYKKLLEALKTKWKAFALAMTCQFGLLPLVCVIWVTIFDCPNDMSLGFLMACSVPGGALSNVFQFYSYADVELGIGSTIMSTLFALVLFPLDMIIYSGLFTDNGDAWELPWFEVILTAVSVCVSTLIGISIKSYFPIQAFYVEKTFSALGVFGMFCGIAFAFLSDPPKGVSSEELWKGICVAILLPCSAYSYSYLLTKYVPIGLNPAEQRTIMLETSLQNLAISTSVTLLAYDSDQQNDILLPQAMFMFTLPITGLTFTIVCAKFFPLEPKTEKDGAEKVEEPNEPPSSVAMADQETRSTV